MRTCPNCGRDTEAETTAPCTQCGWSPVGPAAPPLAEEAAGSFTVGEGPAPSDFPAPPGPGSPAPAPAPAPRKAGVGAVWIVVILIGLAWQAFNVFDGCSDAFESKPGPTAEETESALVSDAAQQGLPGATADCPDSAEDTEVGASFDCTITTASGRSATVPVTNREEEFEWSRRPFFELLVREPR